MNADTCRGQPATVQACRRFICISFRSAAITPSIMRQNRTKKRVFVTGQICDRRAERICAVTEKRVVNTYAASESVRPYGFLIFGE